jgi:hypothetical protein
MIKRLKINRIWITNFVTPKRNEGNIKTCFQLFVNILIFKHIFLFVTDVVVLIHYTKIMPNLF